MTTTHRAAAAICAVALALAACGSEAAPETTTAAAGTSSSSPDGQGATYRSTTFAVPFEVQVPGWLPAQPSTEETHFVTWESTSEDRKVRMLVPVTVYRPGDAAPSPPPEDYLGYLLGQAASGAEFSDKETVQVDGRPATLVTATTTSGSLDGSLGCQSAGMSAEDCWGLQPELVLRIAVVPLEGKTLLVWSRTVRGEPGEDEKVADFERMIASLDLR